MQIEEEQVAKEAARAVEKHKLRLQQLLEPSSGSVCTKIDAAGMRASSS